MRIQWLVLLAACGGSTVDNMAPPPPAIEPQPTYPILSETLALGEIAILQTVKVTIEKDGAAVDSPNAPVIAGKRALARVYVTPKDGWQSRTLDAELRLSVGGVETALLKESKIITTASTDKILASTFNFDIADALMVSDVEYAVVLRDPNVPRDRAEGAVAFPALGSSQFLDARIDAPSVKVKIVPVRYDFDGSGRLPDTTPAQLKLYTDALFKTYPTSSVEITVRDPIAFDQEVQPDGTGWDDLLNAVVAARASDAPPDDVYYMGTFQPAETMQQYCSGGCIVGLSPLASSNDIASRAASMLGFSNSGSSTLQHELGHSMGRAHAPCGGAAGADAKFPYQLARIGVLGYDLLSKRLFDPAANYRDFMGYCHPTWISDYTYAALYARIRYVDKTAKAIQPPPSGFRSLLVGKDGARWGKPLHVPSLPSDADVSFATDSGPVAVRGWFVPYDHLEGGMLVVPANEAPERFTRVAVRGATSFDVPRVTR